MSTARVSAKNQVRLLANGLVHKVRNSLNAMVGQIALLKKLTASATNARVPERLDKLEQAVEHVEKVLQEFLAVASPANNTWEEVDLPALAQETVRQCEPVAKNDRIRLVEEYAEEVQPVYVDRAKLKRALDRLLRNAAEAMPEGGQLRVRLEMAGSPLLLPALRRAGQGVVVLEVSDSGCGIAPEYLERIFQPFFSTKPDGLGLGLAHVKRAMTDLHGRVEFESGVGGGTTFRIYLPSASRLKAALARRARRQEWLQPTP